jgi:hypothetical protein
MAGHEFYHDISCMFIFIKCVYLILIMSLMHILSGVRWIIYAINMYKLYYLHGTTRGRELILKR